jgi:hypothetical protein
MKPAWLRLGVPALPLVLFLALVLPMLAVRAFAHVAFDWGEGWNAYHAAAAMAGRPLYPDPATMMFNNYPPLSFYLVGAAGFLTGDNIVAGRLISLLSVAVLGAGMVLSLRALGARWTPALFGALFTMGQLTIFSEFVGLDAPQLLAHAIAIWGFLLVLRRPLEKRAQWSGALVLAAGFFTKHMLIAQPLALVLWLAGLDRRAALRLALAGLAFLAAGLLACRLLLHVDLVAQLTAARDYEWPRFWNNALVWLSTNALPLLVVLAILPRGGARPEGPVLAYLGIAIVAGCYFHGAPGVLANAMYDADIALGLCIGLAMERLARRPVAFGFMGALLCLAPQLVTIIDDWRGKWLPVLARDYRAREAETGQELALLAAAQGPVLCDTPSLCYWAERRDPVDFFNLMQAWRHGRADDRVMAARIARTGYAIIQLDYNRQRFSTPAIAAALRRYRVARLGPDGEFLVPAR